MNSPRILLTRRWPEPVESYLRSRYDVVLNARDEPLSPAALHRALREFDVLCPTVSDRLPARLFEAAETRVRLICNYGVGHEHIDLPACRARGIVVTNTPDVLTDATAELAILLMLMIARRAGEGEREVRRGTWTGWRPTHLLGTQLSGKTLGLVGFGRIARATARKAVHGMQMRVLYHAPRRASADDESAVGAGFVSDLDTLLGQADVVSLHCPGGVTTAHLIDRRRLGLMKRSAFLINTARGSVVDEAALIDALQTRQIAGAGLDVYAGEPAVSEGFLALDNVVLLPHMGSATNETRIAMGMRAVTNLEAWLAGREPPDRIA